MYHNARRCVRVNAQYNEEFGVEVDMVCIRALSLALCSLSWCWKSCMFHMGLLWVLLYAGDLVLIAGTQECISNLKAWKASMESTGLHVNTKKTKSMVLVSGVDLDVLQKSGKYPCAICCKGVGKNSIECSQCKLWVHKGCNRIIGQLVNLQNYIFPRCKGKSWCIDSRLVTQVDFKGTKLDVEDTCCYLGDMLCSGGGCDSVIAARCCVACGKSGNCFLPHIQASLS